MIEKYLNKIGKYMYLVYLGDTCDEQAQQYNTIYNTLSEAVDAEYLSIEKLPEDGKMKVVIFERGDLFKPSECNAFDEDAITDLLDNSNEMVQFDYFSEAELFDLTDEEIRGLIKLIDDYLDSTIDTSGYYKPGKVIDTVTLTKTELMKLANEEF